jgi:hypothetical protein
MKTKLNRKKFFTGTKKLKNIKMFEEFENKEESIEEAKKIKTMADFFGLSAGEQAKIPMVLGLNPKERSAIQSFAEDWLKDNVEEIPNLEDAETIADKFYEENNEENVWKHIVPADKMEDALNYAKSYIEFNAYI